jgi:hypothetical protein
MQKPAPVYSVELVLHPQRDNGYVHFENASEHPFQPDATEFAPVNVWWLADSALLTYWDEQDAAAIFSRAGLQSRFLNVGSTDCYVAWSSAFVIVAFRGTEPDDWEDVLTDAQIALVPWRVGKVHQGFRDALDRIWPRLEAELDALAGGRTVWFCGHSLGAALATLAADRYARTRGVCTFGCPRVGDPAFASAFKAKLGRLSRRYVNGHDIVTHVPLPPLYRHVDLRRFISTKGSVSETPPSVLHFFEALFGRPSQMSDMIVDLDRGARKSAPMFVLDHMPKAYAIWTWNDYSGDGK